MKKPKKIKMKTKKALIKRIKITKNNKWIRRKANTSHLAASKSRRNRSRLDATVKTKNTEIKKLRRLLNI